MLQSCGTLKKSAPAAGEVESQNLASFKEAYNAALPNFDHLQIRSRIDADVNDKSVKATLRLYLDGNDRIWANASMLGITGARANITQDKVQAYEVLDKTFIDSDFTFFNQKLKVNFITFDKLKQLLLGQLFLIDAWENYRIETTENNQYALSYKLNDALKKKPVDGKYIHTFYLDSNYRLTKVEIFDSESNTEITVNYTNWQLVENKNLPGIVNVLVKGEKEDKIELEYNNFDFSETDPPFRIPDGYTERKID